MDIGCGFGIKGMRMPAWKSRFDQKAKEALITISLFSFASEISSYHSMVHQLEVSLSADSVRRSCDARSHTQI